MAHDGTNILTIKQLIILFQNVILSHFVVPYKCCISVWNWSNMMNVSSALWILMVWRFSTRTSVATVLSTHPYISSCLGVKPCRHIPSWTIDLTEWIKQYHGCTDSIMSLKVTHLASPDTDCLGNILFRLTTGGGGGGGGWWGGGGGGGMGGGGGGWWWGCGVWGGGGGYHHFITEKALLDGSDYLGLGDKVGNIRGVQFYWKCGPRKRHNYI